MADRSVPASEQAVSAYMAAAQHHHEMHCDRCRALHAAADAARAANGASMARRDRLQLGLRPTRTTAVTA
ncbi:hypothetical protein ACF06Q_09355 [Streptomyces leeuwenhoekii]|uniref:hypothetical protein n=1 Tax=Streptomyces leeuwenhoekii TaxID=1437453 RepID=UPI00370080F5